MSEELEGALRTYAPLPPAGWWAETIRTTEDAYTADQMRAFADATCALRAARIGAQGVPDFCPPVGGVPTDAEIQSVWDIACNDTPKSPGWNRHIRYARALLARWGCAAASPQQPFGYWFIDNPENFAMPGSGFKLGHLPPDKSVHAVALYTAPAAVSAPSDAKDAARYRWLRNFHSGEIRDELPHIAAGGDYVGAWALAGDEADTAIDAVMLTATPQAPEASTPSKQDVKE